MKFFFDNCMPLRLAEALDLLIQPDAHKAVHLRKRFAPAIKDEVWVPALGRESGWIVISGDLRITRTPQVKKAWIDSRLPGFFMSEGWANRAIWEQVAHFFVWWPHVLKLTETTRPGMVYKIPGHMQATASKLKLLRL
ncbi:MAG: hypothetical protein E3J64_06500 [Anaerolineales bacterium]|nr:MAG: hypothetical protein E3J64_06500 [Anaerolineales bacterium]